MPLGRLPHELIKRHATYIDKNAIILTILKSKLNIN